MILGQVAPTLNTDTDLYTCPQKKVSTLRVMVCDRGNAASTYRIALRPAGGAIANVHYIVYEGALAASGDEHTVPFELEPGDVVTVRGSTSSLTFNANGVEEPEVE